MSPNVTPAAHEPEMYPQQEVADAEAEAELLEVTVYSELKRLSAVRQELSSELASVRRGATDGELRELAEKLVVPNETLGNALNEAREARLKAVAARKAVAKAAAARLDSYAGELERLQERLREEQKAAAARETKRAAAVVERSEPVSELSSFEAAFAAAADAGASVEAPKPSVGAEPPAGAVVPAPQVDAVPQPAVKPTVVARDNRRSTPRVSLCTEISLASESNFFTGFTNDISEGGLFMATVDVMPIGTEVDVSFSLPSGHKIAAKGEVRWVRDIDELNPENFPGMGIRFTDVNSASVQAIHQFAAEREPMFFPES